MTRHPDQSSLTLPRVSHQVIFRIGARWRRTCAGRAGVLFAQLSGGEKRDICPLLLTQEITTRFTILTLPLLPPSLPPLFATSPALPPLLSLSFSDSAAPPPLLSLSSLTLLLFPHFSPSLSLTLLLLPTSLLSFLTSLALFCYPAAGPPGPLPLPLLLLLPHFFPSSSLTLLLLPHLSPYHSIPLLLPCSRSLLLSLC